VGKKNMGVMMIDGRDSRVHMAGTNEVVDRAADKYYATTTHEYATVFTKDTIVLAGNQGSTWSANPRGIISGKR
jgi:hypothetical protein